LGFAQQNAGGACAIELASVRTPFGNVGLGGFGGDAFPAINGLELLRDGTDADLIDMPTGSYSMRYVGVSPYIFNTTTGELLPPTNVICVDIFSSPNGVITGTATGWSTIVSIAGTFPLPPGIDGGSSSAPLVYDAGTRHIQRQRPVQLWQ
jgi:hypothetical protein